MFHMVSALHSYRHPKRGIVLVATLVSLMLIIGLVGMLQASALTNTKTIKRLSQVHIKSLRLNSVRELSRPQVARLALDENLSVLQIDAVFQKQDYDLFVTKENDEEFVISIAAKTP